MPFSGQISVSAPDVMHESFDDETVIVNLHAGAYFSLNRDGLPLWQEISRGTTEAALREIWQQTHGGEAATAREVIEAFLWELKSEGLIATDGVERPLAGLETPRPGSGQRPSLQKFTDLEDLLKLDPIHDVDERGWPHARAPDTASPPPVG